MNFTQHGMLGTITKASKAPASKSTLSKGKQELCAAWFQQEFSAALCFLFACSSQRS
jgi:hypothetical protein